MLSLRVERNANHRRSPNIPPRNLKSICSSVALPAFLLGHNPTKKIICVSYSDDLAAKFSNDCRAVMRSDWYKQTFPRARIDKAKDTESEVRTTERGYRLATSVGGTLTGRGGDIIIIDDPIKPQDAQSKSVRDKTIQWYENTLLSRLDDKVHGAIVVVMQRLHLDDLAGHLLERGGLSTSASRRSRRERRLFDLITDVPTSATLATCSIPCGNLSRLSRSSARR